MHNQIIPQLTCPPSTFLYSAASAQSQGILNGLEFTPTMKPINNKVSFNYCLNHISPTHLHSTDTYANYITTLDLLQLYMMLKNLTCGEKFPNFQASDCLAERESTGKTNLFNTCEMKACLKKRKRRCGFSHTCLS